MAEYTTADEQYGIATTLEGYVIESENITKTPQVEPVPNQKNQVEDEIEYDTRWELRLTVRGKNKPSAAIMKYGKKADGKDELWAVDSVEDAGSYNGLKRYNITAHHTTKYPKDGATARTQA